MLLAARLVPERAGSPTQAVVHIPIGQLREMPGAPGLEDEWLRGRVGQGEPGYLDSDDAKAAACDAQTAAPRRHPPRPALPVPRRRRRPLPPPARCTTLADTA